MHLRTVVFNSSRYTHLADVLAYSVQKNSPNTPLTVHQMEGAQWRRSGLSPYQAGNFYKTRFHKDIVEGGRAGEVLGLIDADTLVLGDLSEVEKMEFDLCVTVRPYRSPINSGVVFVRVSERTKDFYRRWAETAERFADNPRLFQQWKRNHLGINQSSLAKLLEEDHQLIVLRLPCAIWNCVYPTWRQFSSATKILHLLGELRAALFCKHRVMDASLLHLAQIWKRYEAELLSLQNP